MLTAFMISDFFTSEVATRPAHTANFVVLFSLFFIAAIFLTLLGIKHIAQINNNETTVEYEAIERYIRGDMMYADVFHAGPMASLVPGTDRVVLNPYNLGTRENWLEVFGDDMLYWLLPMCSSRGDGISFRTHSYDPIAPSNPFR